MSLYSQPLQLSQSNSQLANSQFKHSYKSESYFLKHQKTSSSLNSHTSTGSTCSVFSNSSNTSQSHSVRRAQLNKDLPPLPPSKNTENKPKTFNTLPNPKVPPPRPSRPTDSVTQLPPSEFRNRIYNATYSSAQKSKKSPIRQKYPNSELSLTNPSKDNNTNHRNSAFKPNHQIKYSLSHNHLITKPSNSNPFSQTNCSESNVNKYSVYDSDASLSDEDFGTNRSSSTLLQNQELFNKKNFGFFNRRKNSSFSSKVPYSQLARTSSLNEGTTHLLPNHHKVCFIFSFINLEIQPPARLNPSCFDLFRFFF